MAPAVSGPPAGEPGLNRIARASAAERAVVFEAAAGARGLSPVLLEKDFWVCWTLERLFALPAMGQNLLFKGGTSLSKVYGVIERFSEDIDLSLSRDFLGFGGEREPERALSKTQQRRRIEALLAAFYATMTEQILPALHAAITEILGDDGWTLTATEPGILEFAYPVSLDSPLAYVRPVVRIEMGSRNDTWPAEERFVTPYLTGVTAGTSAALVRVLAVERTFWEKVTILHDEFYRPLEKVRGARLSRHYYDLAQLATHPEIGPRALTRFDLLARVAQHKDFFYRNSWSRYDLALPGTLRLLPPPERLPGLRSDYARMRDMFFAEPPIFDSLLSNLRTLEARLNS